MNKNNIWFNFIKHLSDTVQNICCDVEQGLTCFHNGQIIVRHNMERIKHLIEHLTMLTRYANNGFQILS